MSPNRVLIQRDKDSEAQRSATCGHGETAICRVEERSLRRKRPAKTASRESASAVEAVQSVVFLTAATESKYTQ